MSIAVKLIVNSLSSAGESTTEVVMGPPSLFLGKCVQDVFQQSILGGLRLVNGTVGRSDSEHRVTRDINARSLGLVPVCLQNDPNSLANESPACRKVQELTMPLEQFSTNGNDRRPPRFNCFPHLGDRLRGF